MTQEEIDNTVVDVIYDDTQIYHVLEPNLEGVRGVPLSQYMMRDKIVKVKENLSHLNQEKITEFENQLNQ